MKLLHLLCLIGLAVQTIGLQKAEDLQVTGNPHIAPKPLDAATAGGQVSARRQRLIFFPLQRIQRIGNRYQSTVASGAVCYRYFPIGTHRYSHGSSTCNVVNVGADMLCWL